MQNSIRTALFTIFLAPLIAASALAGTVSGHVRDLNGAGLKDVDLDFFDAVTGVKLATPGDTTGVGGSFSLTVPNGKYRISFDPTLVTGATLAPKQIFNITINGATDLGNIILQPGIVITGKVTAPGGAGVANVDLDLIDAVSTVKAFTPNDNTDNAGNFSIITEKGNFIIQVQPSTATKLLAKRFGPFNLQSNSAVGTFAMSSGALLSGNVTSGGGLPIANVNLDVKDLSTGLAVPMLDDITNAAGHYQVVVPIGNIQITWNPPAGSIYGTATISNITISGDQTLAAVLPNGGAADPSPTTLRAGDTMLGSFASSQEVDEVRFTAIAGQFITMDARKSAGTAVPGLELLAPGDLPVALTGFVKTSSLGTKVTKLPVALTGEYRILIFPIAGTSGNYKIKITATTPPALKTIPVAGSIVNSGDMIEFTFDAPAGAVLKGSLAPAKGSVLAPAISGLVAPDLSLLAVVEQFVLPNLKITIGGTGTPLPQTGTYKFKVAGNATSTGAFTGSLKITYPKTKPAVVAET